MEEIDRLLPCDMGVSFDRIVPAMIPDALTGRTPLFRLGDFFADKDVKLLLGEAILLAKFSDHTLGRVLERLARAGTNKILGAVAHSARVCRASLQGGGDFNALGRARRDL